MHLVEPPDGDVVPPPPLLPLIKDYDFIVEFYAAGPRKAKEECFAEIAAEARAYGRHRRKGPSFQEFTLCTGQTPCDVCKEVFARRQCTKPAWHPKALLAPLEFNDYFLPWPVPRKQEVCAEHGPSGAGQVVVAQDVATQDAAMQHAARRSQLGVLLANAIKDEDFMEAHRIKQLLAETATDSPEVAAKPSPAASSSAGASEPRATCLVPLVASSDEVHLRPDYLPLREVV